ncbi:YtfJ family protein [Kalamiella sp. sgz302252]|uniref:YtfJ family protein n=1 Tax=Pantoea sp. sgz302252 TaxID=3341827 RepID=UPI0036D26B9A
MKPVLFALLFCLSAGASANNLVLNQRVPATGVAVQGELIWQRQQIAESPWNSSQLGGKVRVLLHMAGRISAKDQNAALIEALSKANFPHDRYQTTTIVNTDDVIPGSAIFVRASLKSAKESSPWSQFIIDSRGEVKRAWQLKAGGSAVIVLDSAGRVRFAREGALTAEENQQVLTLLETLLQPNAS